MTFESVRLTHAQSVANHYITNQIYIPTDEDHKSRGSFLILLDSIGAKDGTFTASLVNTLIREYYRSADADRLAVFEQALVRVNNLLKTPRDEESSDTRSLDGCIVLVTSEEIHVTYIGTCHAFLHRQKNLLHLVDPSLDENPTGGFSVITSGEVLANDVLVMGTPESTAAQFQDDVTFSLKHDPLFEAGRSLARLFKQHNQHSSEVQFVRFTETEETHEQIYCDKPLESSSEKMEHFQKQAKHHSELIFSGVHFLSQKALGIMKKGESKAPKVAAIPEPSFDEFVADDANAENNTVVKLEALNEEEPMVTRAPAEVVKEKAVLDTMPDDAADRDEATGNYAVKHYWESGHERSEAPEPAAEPQAEIKPLKATMRHDDGEVEEFEPAPLTTGARFKPSLPSVNLPALFAGKWWQNRLLYLGVAVVIVVILGVRISGSLQQQSSTPDQSITERDSLIALAQTALRDSDSAQIQDDTSTAITHLLAAQTALAKITETNINEQSKSLAKQATDGLTRLTTTTALKANTTNELPEKATKVVTTANGTYAFLTNNTITQTKEVAITPLTGIPTYSALIDAVAYDSLQRVAFAVTVDSATKLYSLTTSTNQIQELTRSDSKLWPETKTLASFSTNLYVVGPTMFKGTRSTDTVYKVTSYANGASTQTIKSIVANGGIFYALSNDRDLLRIAANSPITPVSLVGVPDVFLPKAFASILTSQADATLSFFDAEGQRVLVFSSDGAYRKQYTLPTGTTFTTCDLNEKTLVCASQDKKLATFGL